MTGEQRGLRDFALAVAAAVIAIVAVLLVLGLAFGGQPTRADLMEEIQQMQHQQFLITELLRDLAETSRGAT